MKACLGIVDVFGIPMLYHSIFVKLFILSLFIKLALTLFLFFFFQIHFVFSCLFSLLFLYLLIHLSPLLSLPFSIIVLLLFILKSSESILKSKVSIIIINLHSFVLFNSFYLILLFFNLSQLRSFYLLLYCFISESLKFIKFFLLPFQLFCQKLLLLTST